MNFQGKAILVYLEEDNIQKAYFRVRPLMTQEGPVGPMEGIYPDDGYLRIVPDRNEQHTFKERMRALSGLCLVDLRFFQPDANKIRTNKNYAPARGETNQFIVYSDAVRALPDDLLYQVVAEGDVSRASTPYVYIRNGANIQGPFRSVDGQAADELRPVPPDSAEIHSVQVNGQELLFYWPRQAEEKPAIIEENAAAPQEEAADEAPETANAPLNAYDQIQAMDVQVSENANKLQDAPAFPAPLPPAEQQSAKPLSGTRLYQAPQRPVQQRRAHNPLMEVVERERYAARYEAPGATLPQTAELKNVDNPADALKRALQNLWQNPETQRQAVDVLLNQPGMRQMLSQSLTKETNDLTLAAMQSQLQEMEAERLMTLMQLDDAKKNLAAVREEAVGKLTSQEQKKLDEINAAKESARDALAELEQRIEPLRREAEESLEKLNARNKLILPVLGKDASREELIGRVDAALKAAGFQMEEGDAEALLTAYALCDDEISFYADAEKDGRLAIRAFAAALGVQAQDIENGAEAVILPGGDAPVLMIGHQPHGHPLLTCCFYEWASIRKETYRWPHFPVCPTVPVAPALDTLPQALPAYPAAIKAAVIREMTVETPLSDETKAVILSLRKAVQEVLPLPLDAVRQMCRFIACTQNTLKGGVAEAIDRAVCLYAAPFLASCADRIEEIKPLLSAMPRTLKALKA